MPASPSWTPERVALLSGLWRDGLTAAQIARRLAGGISRNAVLGKLHRLGLLGRPQTRRPSSRVMTRRRPARMGGAPVPTATPPSAFVCDVGSATVPSVARGECRWPVGDPFSTGFRLCGGPVTRGAYCARHAARAYRPLRLKPPADHLLKLAGLA